VIFDGEEAPESAQSTWIVAKSPEEALSKAEAKFGAKQFRLEQDPDCLE
jgi:valyl-tRNA synthetase